MNSHKLTVEELATELAALRETPSEEFASRLDARAAGGFPRRGTRLRERFAGSDAPRRLADRARSASPRYRLLPALAGVASVIVIATVVVVSSGSDQGGSDPVKHFSAQPGVGASSGAAKAGGAAPAHTQAGNLHTGLGGESVIAPEPTVPGNPGRGTAPGVGNRQVQRSAELTLGTDPEKVQDVAAKTIDVVGRYRGIVLSSNVRGAGDEAGATFDLLIPSARLSPALADLSGLAELRSRSENTLDITAPFVSAREHLRDSRAEAEGLLRQLAAADTDAERAGVKAQLRVARGRIAAFRSRVNRLERRASFSRVSLDIVGGQAGAVTPVGDGGDWTIGDALHDAGRVLAVAAGIGLLGAALLLPLGLLGGAAWAARRVYLRRARAQTLSA